MFSSIRTCEANRAVISALTSKLQLGTENVIARLALAYSLSHEQQLNLKEIKDSKGKEYSKTVLFGDNLPYYIATIAQLYSIHKSSREIPRYIKLHIDNGIELLGKEILDNPNQLVFDFLLKIIGKGLNN